MAIKITKSAIEILITAKNIANDCNPLFQGRILFHPHLNEKGGVK
ncbi:MAG: hypothetical protein NTU74_00985 [Deltaproteobacteria bacterium]|nr:hypothetical protein [Deltaproteobacteria bacterium]